MKQKIKNIIISNFNKILSESELDTHINNSLEIKSIELNAHKEKNIEHQLAINALKTTTNYVEKNMIFAKAFSTNYEIYNYVLDKINEKQGIFCEFGIYQGNSINYIASKSSRIIHGFDSFEGLPEFWRDGFEQGSFKLNNTEIPAFNKNVKLHIGLFENTLKDFIQEYDEPVIFIHVDCDLYSSSKTIFNYLGKNIIKGSIIIFDEYFNYPGWQQHEFRAFQEFVDSYNINYKYICYNKFHEQVAVEIL